MNHALNDTEIKAEEKFAKAHWKRCGSDRRTLHLTPTGIGDVVVIECLKCGKKKDITNYNRW